MKEKQIFSSLSHEMIVWLFYSKMKLFEYDLMLKRFISVNLKYSSLSLKSSLMAASENEECKLQLKAEEYSLSDG